MHYASRFNPSVGRFRKTPRGSLFFPYTQLKDSFLRGEKKMGVSTYRCLNTWGRDPVFLLYNIIYFLGSDFTLLSLFLRAFAKSRESYCFPFCLSFFDRFFFWPGGPVTACPNQNGWRCRTDAFVRHKRRASFSFLSAGTTGKLPSSSTVGMNNDGRPLWPRPCTRWQWPLHASSKVFFYFFSLI